jgi:hypothetical protein
MVAYHRRMRDWTSFATGRSRSPKPALPARAWGWLLCLCLVAQAPAVGDGDAQDETDRGAHETVLCLIGDECLLTTRYRCDLMGGIANPRWEVCVPLLNLSPRASDAPKEEECAFPYDLDIRGRNQLIFRSGPYEVRFSHGDRVTIDYTGEAFVINDSLIHAPRQPVHIDAGTLAPLQRYFGMGPPMSFSWIVPADPSAQAKAPSREQACIWLEFLRLLERTGSVVEVYLSQGKVTFTMSPLDEN